MTQWLRQSTASQPDVLGPFVDDTDGVTPETALSIANTDIRLSKNGGNMAAKNSGGGTHDELGQYAVTFDATDTNTLGRLKAVVKMAGSLLVESKYLVVPAEVYDAMVLGTDNLTIDLSTQAKADVNTEADTALTDYDPATKAEMDTAHGLLATEAKQDTIDGIVDAIKLITDALPNSGALTDISTATDRLTAARAQVLTDLINGGRLDLIIDIIAADTTTDIPGLIAALNDLSAAQVNTEVDTALATTTYAEPSAVPAATASIVDKINWICAVARNQFTQTATLKTLRNAADTSNIATAPVSSNGTTFTVGAYS